MYRRHTSSAAAVVRLPPLPNRPKTNVSVIEDPTENPWGLDNPALRQLSTHAASRTMRNRSRATRRSFRSSKVTLPDINGRKTRQTGSARSMRSTYSTISNTTINSTKSLDMFRYNMPGLRTPHSVSSAPTLQVPTPHRKWKTPGSALSINSVSTIHLPPIEVTVHRTYSRGDIASTAIPDDIEDDVDDDDVISVWPGAAYPSPRSYSRPSLAGNDDVISRDDTTPTSVPTSNGNPADLQDDLQTAAPPQISVQDTSADRPGDNESSSHITQLEAIEDRAEDSGFVPEAEAREGNQFEDEMTGINVTGEDVTSEIDDLDVPEDAEDAARRMLEEEERHFRSLPPRVQIARVFAGDFRFLPPMVKTSVRVFFWASPNGFHEEREWIHSRCHTELQEFCALRGLDFHLVDLHLSGYDHVSHRAMDEIFRDQLATCQRLSFGPTVLALVNGDDMPRALPPSMDPVHFSAICEIADRKELPHRELLTAHFRSVTSANGTARYQLQTTTGPEEDEERSGSETERMALLGEWDMVAVRLRELLRRTLVTAVVERKLSKAQAKAYLESDPGEQVRQMVSSYPGQALCYIRQHLEESEADPLGISRASSSASMASSSERDKSNTMSRSLLSGRLSVDISKKLNFLNYPLPDLNSHGRVYNLQPLRDEEAEPANLSQQQRAYLTRLCDDVLCDVKGTVSRADDRQSRLEKRWRSSPLHREVLHHARLCVSRAAAYRGPDMHLSQVKEYLLDDNYSMVPLVISGGADKNKSKLMAQITQHVHSWIQPECAVIVRFLGTSPDSSDIKRVLLGIIYQICLIYAMTMPKLEEVGNFDATVSCFNALLASVAIKHCASRPLVLLLDCLEKATSTQGNHTAAWLPQTCPPNVFMVTSIASDCQHLLEVLQMKLIEDVCFLSLDKPVVAPSSPNITKPPTERDPIPRTGSGCSDSDSYETEDTLEGSNTEEDEVGLAELVSRRLDVLEERHGDIVITWLLSYLSIGEGVTEIELLDALSCNEEVMEEVYIGSDVPVAERARFPQKLWALIQRDIRRFVEERYIDNKVVLSINDEQVQETVESRYLNEGRRCECCTQLASTLQGFQNGNLYDEDEDDLVVQRLLAPQPLSVTNHRRLRRLPVLLYRSHPFDSISQELKSQMLCNFNWLLTKLKSLQFHNLIDDYLMIRESDDDIEFVRDLLMLCQPVIELDPERLCAEVLARLTLKTCSNRPLLQQLMVDGSSWCSNLSEGMYLLPKFPCLPSPSGYLRRTIQGPWHVLGMCGDSLAIVWGRETGLEVWNATTSECLHHFSNPYTWEDTYLSADNRFVYQTFNTKLMGWDVHTAKKVCDLNILPAVSDTGRKQNPNVDDSFITPMAVSDDKMFAAIRINKPEMLLNGKGLAIVDLNRELVVHTAIEAMGDRVSNCKFTTDNNRLIVTETQIMPGQVSEIHIFDCLTMEVMGDQMLVENYTIVPDTLYLSSDESKIIIGCRPDNFLVFAVSDCSPLYVPLEPPTEDMARFVDMKMLPSDRVLLLSVDITQAAVLRISDLEGNLQGNILTSNTGRPKFVEASGFHSLAFVGFLEVGAVDVWDLERSCLLYTLLCHSGHITSTVMSPTCHNLYTGATDGVIKVWKLQEMMENKGRTLQVENIPPEPQLQSARKQSTLHQVDGGVVSGIATDVDDIAELDGGESLVDSQDEETLEQLITKQDQMEGEVDGSIWTAVSEVEPTETGVTEEDQYGDSGSDSDLTYQDDGMSYDTRDMLSTAVDSRLESASTRYTSNTKATTTLESHAGDTMNHGSNSAQSGVSSKRSATKRRQNTSAPGWARDGSFLNRTIIEDELVADSIDIQQLVSGQRMSARSQVREENGSFSQRSGCSVRSGASQKSSHRSSVEGHQSTANTDRTNDTNAKLEEIFRKLDQQVLQDTPRYDTCSELSLSTTLLGKHGENLEGLPFEMRDINDIQPTLDGINLVTSHKKGPPVLWSIDRAEIVHRMEVPWDTGTTTELLLAPDGRRIFGLSRLGYAAAEKSGYENCVRVWDIETGACSQMQDEPLYADAFAFTPDKKRLILLRKRDNGHTRFVVLDADNLECLLLGEVGSTLCSPYVYVTSDVRYVITCDPGRLVSVWSVQDEDEYGVSRHVDLPLATIPPAMTLVDAERTLLLGTGFGNVLSLPLEQAGSLPHRPDPSLRVIQEPHRGEVICLELSGDRKLLVTSGSDHCMKVIDREARTTRHTLRGHTDLVTCMQVSNDNCWLVSGSHDKSVRMWSLQSGQMVCSFYTHHDVFRVHLSEDHQTLSCLVDQRGSRSLFMLAVVRADSAAQESTHRPNTEE